jgi:ATP-binding cassette subfamily F protein uup
VLLLRLANANLQYGTRHLLDGVELSLRRGERLGLLGRNGEGKSSLLRVLAAEQALDGGERWLRPGARLAHLAQALPEESPDSVFDVVASGLAETGALLARYHHLSQDADAAPLEEMSRVQQQLEQADGWNLQTRVQQTISRLGLDADAPMNSLSGGWRRRVALARALVCSPDVLLLDEPTNHLDIPSIEWLEEQLRSFDGAIVLVTHDRRFLQGVSNRIAELDRGRLTSWDGDYQGFLKHRELQLQAEERADALFDRKLAQEEAWIRQGIKARRTRNEGRVRALKAMREERRQRRDKQGTAVMSLEEARSSGKIVAELNQVSHAFGEQVILRDFSTIIQRGDRVGIVGANGAGKTTLVRIMLGELVPDSGSVRLGTNLEIAYSDQYRDSLDPEKNLIDNICGGREFIEVGGKRRHAISYLGDFLFGPERTRMPVKALSGGEQNRAILAQLFSKPANLLVLDEPTNDLDVETLELLEEMLLQFQGTVLLISHDREFMDRVVTSLLVLEGDGVVSEQAGGFSDWTARGGKLREPERAPLPDQPQPPQESRTAPTARKRKLSYKHQRELEQLPARVEALEARQAQLEADIAEPGFYQQDHRQVEGVLQALGEVQSELESAMERWVELEE